MKKRKSYNEVPSQTRVPAMVKYCQDLMGTEDYTSALPVQARSGFKTERVPQPCEDECHCFFMHKGDQTYKGWKGNE